MIPVKPKNIDFHWILLFILSFILSVFLSPQFGAVVFYSPEAFHCKTARLVYILFFYPIKANYCQKTVNLENKQNPKIMYYTNLCCKIIELSYSLDLFWKTSDANLDESWNKHIC